MKYSSILSPDKKVTTQQYIAEIVCINNSKKINRDIPPNFWRDKSWTSFYIIQLKYSKLYLSKYDESIILSFIREKNVYNLMYKWIDKELNKRQKNKPVIQPTDLEVHKDATFKKQTNKNLDFLDD